MVGGLKDESKMNSVLAGPAENLDGGSDEMILKVEEELMKSETDLLSTANDGTAAEEAMFSEIALMLECTINRR